MTQYGIVNLTGFWQTGGMKHKTPSYQRHRFPVWSKHSSSLAVSETLPFLMRMELQKEHVLTLKIPFPTQPFLDV